MRHQHAERLQRACAAVEEGTSERKVLGVRASDQLRNFKTQDSERQKQTEGRWKRRSAAIALPTALDFSHAHVFVEPAAAASLSSEQWARGRRTLKFITETDRRKASVFVVQDPSRPGKHNRIVAAMVGGVLCTAEGLLSRDTGVVMRLLRGLRLRRHIFVSNGVKTAEEGTLAMVMEVCRCSGQPMRWQWYDESQRHVFRDKLRRRGTRNAVEMVALITKEEPDLCRDFPRWTSLSSFLMCTTAGKGFASGEGKQRAWGRRGAAGECWHCSALGKRLAVQTVAQRRGSRKNEHRQGLSTCATRFHITTERPLFTEPATRLHTTTERPRSLRMHQNPPAALSHACHLCLRGL